MKNKEPNPEVVEWLINLNREVGKASEEEREEIFKELRESTLDQFSGAGLDPFNCFVLLRFEILPTLIEAAGITLHDALDDYFIEEIMDATQTPEQFLHFCKIFFPMFEQAGIIPLANERMFNKFQEILGPEAQSVLEISVQITPKETFAELSSFLTPYIDQAMKDPFAQNDVIIEDEKGKRPSGKYWHVFYLLKEVLHKFSTPDVTVEE